MRRLVWIAGLLFSGPMWPATGLAQDVDVRIYSDAPGGGALVAADFDFSAPNPISESFCVGGTCLFATTDPGFRTPPMDRPGESLFALDAGTVVLLEIVAIHESASVKVGANVIDAPGESASLGTATGVHLHPEFQVVLPEGTTGQFPVSFQVTGTGYGESPVYDLVLSNEPAPSPNPSPRPTPSPSPIPSPSPGPSRTPTPSSTPASTPTPMPTGAPAIDAYLLYKAKPSKLDTDPTNHQFPKRYNVNLDDVMLPNAPAAEHPDDPENYTVKLASGLANPISLDAGPVEEASRHYLRYAIKESKEGVGAPDAKGRFPKAVRAPRRLVEVENRFGTLFVESGRATALLLPAGASELGIPSPVGDETHYLCYSARSSRLPSDQAPDVKSNGKGRFRSDLQVFASDAFEDCAVEPGGAPSFAGTSVAGSCLVDLKKPRLLCMPAAKSAVEPPRDTTALIEESFPSNPAQSLLCYGAKLARKIRSVEAARLGDVAVGEKVEQSEHVARKAKDGAAVRTQPGNGFPAPAALDTKVVEALCLPTTVLSTSPLE